MSDEKTLKKLYSLLSLEDFKALMGIDDREDKLSKFCLKAATLSIENYCKRKLLRKKQFERNDFYGNLFLPLREYPVSDVLAVFVFGNGEILEPEFYHTVPDCGLDLDLPFNLSLSPVIMD